VAKAEPKTATTSPAELIAGDGMTRTWQGFASGDAVVTSGIWESEPFSKTKSHPDSMEFCFIIEGQVELSDSQGHTASFGPGDAFVVQPGFDGVWRSVTRVRKYYVVAKCK
jgi:uncharacterized cupin superfamily protein